MMMRTRSSHPSKSTRRTDFGPRRAASPSRTGTPGCPTSSAAPSAASSPPRCSSRSWPAERGTGRAPRRSSDETRRRLPVHPLVDLRDMPVGGLEPWPAGLLRHLRFDGYLRESLDALREAQDQSGQGVVLRIPLILFLALARLYFTARSEQPSRRAISLTGRRTTACMSRRRSWTFGSRDSAATSSSAWQCFMRANPGSDSGPVDAADGPMASRPSVCRASLRSIRHASRRMSSRAPATVLSTSTGTGVPPGPATMTTVPRARAPRHSRGPADLCPSAASTRPVPRAGLRAAYRRHARHLTRGALTRSQRERRSLRSHTSSAAPGVYKRQPPLPSRRAHARKKAAPLVVRRKGPL